MGSEYSGIVNGTRMLSLSSATAAWRRSCCSADPPTVRTNRRSPQSEPCQKPRWCTGVLWEAAVETTANQSDPPPTNWAFVSSPPPPHPTKHTHTHTHVRTETVRNKNASGPTGPMIFQSLGESHDTLGSASEEVLSKTVTSEVLIASFFCFPRGVRFYWLVKGFTWKEKTWVQHLGCWWNVWPSYWCNDKRF